MKFFNLKGWRVCYYGAGVIGLIVAFLTGTTLSEPERKVIGEENTKDGKKNSLLKVILQPRFILLVIAASIRHSGKILFYYSNFFFIVNTY